MMRCLDPVVTIVSALTVEEVFVLPLEKDRKKIIDLKLNLSNNSLSDHKMLLNIFKIWKNESEKNEFCKKNMVSNLKMGSILNTKKHIMAYLERAKFITKNPSDHSMNENSPKWEVVKACLVAGLSPNLCSISDFEISSSNDSQVVPHKSSVLCDITGKLIESVEIVGAQWLVYSNKTNNKRFTLIRNNTLVPVIDILLFAGDSKLSDECLRKQCTAMADSTAQFQINEWISINVTEEQGLILLRLRQKIFSLFSRFLASHSSFRPTKDELKVLQVIFNILSQEDNTNSN